LDLQKEEKEARAKAFGQAGGMVEMQVRAASDKYVRLHVQYHRNTKGNIDELLNNIETVAGLVWKRLIVIKSCQERSQLVL
jgi:hypothetical protein